MFGRRKEGKYTASQIANFFLSRINTEQGDSISPLKLQKLIYYAQAWHYTLFDKPLFKEPIQAWVHGPVVPQIYARFAKYTRNTTINLQEEAIDVPEFEENTKQILEEVNEIYGEHSGSYLEKLTHSESPWINARRGYKPYENCQEEISLKSMKEFYSEKLVGN
ncbi:Panacea domain-containing protein [Nafulsella turpanensis]|uniref:Panacea domain-containing protein n=1 Tax=Nafulsella turpanensis TaxID=1265690 RepID=UPI0003686CBF|nr:type II toxin-antitoxin system antitoxin SocA domain-containing protein [Nafulsella turpanensis]